MATQQTHDALKHFREHWELGLRSLTQGRDQLLAWQIGGLFLLDNKGDDELSSLVENAEDAIQRVLRVLTEMESI